MKKLLSLCISIFFISIFLFQNITFAQRPIVRKAGKEVLHQVFRLTEKDLGKSLTKALTVLPLESQHLLKTEFERNPALLTFFQKHPTFVSSWSHLHQQLPEKGLDPDFLKMFVHANQYASARGNRLENYVYRQQGTDAVQVWSKDEQHLLATIRPGRVIVVASGQVNSRFLQLKPTQNARYFIEGAEYHTDEMGRVNQVKALLTPNHLKVPQHRDSKIQYDMNVCKKSETSDEAGHLIGNQFGGSTNMVNLVPMHHHVNHGSFKQIENEWRRQLAAGKQVDVEIKVRYPFESMETERPDWFEVVYTIEGKRHVEVLKNE